RGWLVGVAAVQADDGVEVDDAAGLVLGDFGEGDADLPVERRVGHPGGGGEVAAQVGGEAAPQLSGVGVPQHVADVVVGVGVERLADALVVAAMAFEAGRASAARVADAAGAMFVRAAMHWPE